MRDNNLLLRIKERMGGISANEKLDDAIKCHYDIVHEIYLANPLYFKIALKSNRFIVISAILAIYYTNESPSFKEVKKFCIKNDLLSNNTLDSFISFLRVAGRLKAIPDENDKRRLSYRPTQKKLEEVTRIFKSIILPYSIIYPDVDIGHALNHEEFISGFFKNYSEVVFGNIFIHDVIPDCRDFVSRDGGHMIMFNLYVESLRQNTPNVQYNYLKASFMCAVSRSHIKRCLQLAEYAGLLTLKDNGQLVELSPRFIRMVRDCFSFYLTTTEHGLMGMKS
ncbi:hypothetical protein [Serratia silvae]|uniref:MarR family transcriptional regulator n=1 Tax=Serratia silvae TaxID=2824122 RepID=A0ABT0KAF6_9GAMM|nr:hypothetical protein [Serratia silvae]MCL1028990.1 hypothetical protein [Serratia silvae]